MREASIPGSPLHDDLHPAHAQESPLQMVVEGCLARFDDEEVKKYKFTATFESENIDQALKAMQLSYHFNYTKKDNQIMIVK